MTTPELGLPMVYLVDDEEVVRQGIAWLLRTRRLLSEGFDSGEAFEAVLTACRIGRGPRRLAGFAIVPGARPAHGRHERARAVRAPDRARPARDAAGHLPDRPRRRADRGGAVKRGAFDFVEKPFSNNALVDRVEQALAISTAALLERRELAARQRRLEQLSKREREVMELVARACRTR